LDLESLLNEGAIKNIRRHGSFKDLLKEIFGGLVEGPDKVGEPFGVDDNFLRLVLGRSRSWWNGPNVCVRKNEYEEGPESDPDSRDFDSTGIFGSVSSTSTQCSTTEQEHKCIVRIEENGRARVRETTYECCHGFEREAGQTGCTKVLELKPLLETLQERNMSIFAKALEDLGLAEKLSTGNYTLFVPEAEAMNAAAQKEGITAVVTGTEDSMEFVRNIVKNHIVDNWLTTANMDEEGTIPTQDPGATLRFNRFGFHGERITANCARLTRTNQKASNGLIHNVDRLLMPAKDTIAQIISGDPDLSAFRETITPETLVELNKPDGHFTVFAFVNDAFDKLPEDHKAMIRNNASCVHGLIKEHIFPHTICSEKIEGRMLAANSAGHLVKMSRDDETDTINVGDGQIVARDKMASNGVIHMIDHVLFHTSMLDTLAVIEEGKGRDFAEFAKSTGVSEEIRETPEMTVFLPPQELLKEKAAKLKDDPVALKKLIQAHVGTRRLMLNPADVKDGETELELNNLGGSKMKVKFERSFLGPFRRPGIRASVQCANVVRPNLKTCNGVIHRVDRVLSVPTKTVMELIKANPEYSNFALLVEAAGKDSMLSAKNFTGTVFAITNKALEKSFGQTAMDELLRSDAKVNAFVNMHIVPELYCCNQLGGNMWLRTSFRALSGDRISTSDYGHFKVVGDRGRISRCDLIGINGILHQVEGPIKGRRDRASDVLTQLMRLSTGNILNA
jgi:transforming growth factor-beta-induced protein